MKLRAGDEICEKLIKTLGLPKHTKGIELRFYVDEVITVKCEYYPELNEGAETIFAEYRLEKIENENRKPTPAS